MLNISGPRFKDSGVGLNSLWIDLCLKAKSQHRQLKKLQRQSVDDHYTLGQEIAATRAWQELCARERTWWKVLRRKSNVRDKCRSEVPMMMPAT